MQIRDYHNMFQELQKALPINHKSLTQALLLVNALENELITLQKAKSKSEEKKAKDAINEIVNKPVAIRCCHKTYLKNSDENHDGFEAKAPGLWEWMMIRP